MNDAFADVPFESRGDAYAAKFCGVCGLSSFERIPVQSVRDACLPAYRRIFPSIELQRTNALPSETRQEAQFDAITGQTQEKIPPLAGARVSTRFSRLLWGANFPAANDSLTETRNALKSRSLICVKCRRCLLALLPPPPLPPFFALHLSLFLCPFSVSSPRLGTALVRLARCITRNCTLKLYLLSTQYIPAFLVILFRGCCVERATCSIHS